MAPSQRTLGDVDDDDLSDECPLPDIAECVPNGVDDTHDSDSESDRLEQQMDWVTTSEIAQKVPPPSIAMHMTVHNDAAKSISPQPLLVWNEHVS